MLINACFSMSIYSLLLLIKIVGDLRPVTRHTCNVMCFSLNPRFLAYCVIVLSTHTQPWSNIIWCLSMVYVTVVSSYGLPDGGQPHCKNRCFMMMHTFGSAMVPSYYQMWLLRMVSVGVQIWLMMQWWCPLLVNDAPTSLNGYCSLILLIYGHWWCSGLL